MEALPDDLIARSRTGRLDTVSLEGRISSMRPLGRDLWMAASGQWPQPLLRVPAPTISAVSERLSESPFAEDDRADITVDDDWWGWDALDDTPEEIGSRISRDPVNVLEYHAEVWLRGSQLVGAFALTSDKDAPSFPDRIALRFRPRTFVEEGIAVEVSASIRESSFDGRVGARARHRILEAVATEYYEYDEGTLYDEVTGNLRPNAYSFGRVEVPADFDIEVVEESVHALNAQFRAYRSLESEVEQTVESIDIDAL